MSEPYGDAITFEDLGLSPELLRSLTELGYEEPTPIQAAAIPPVLSGSDLLGQAATGTGKTAAFALPILERLQREGNEGTDPMALVLVPTRELAIQVSEAVHRYGRNMGARVLPVYGGQPIGRQLGALQRGVDVVVATPGRALDHISRGSLRLDSICVVVLDEADEMMDMGFTEDIESLLDAAPEERQTVLFSATMPPRIESIARRYLSDPERIRIEATIAEPGEAPKVTEVAYLVGRAHKPAALGRILDVQSPGAALVFCRTRTEVDQLTETLNGRGYRAEALHGGMNQEGRDRVMGRLRAGTADLLVATDVAARGLDVDLLTHVVNYNVPSSPETYVHRIGRVGRAGREGSAITLAEPREHRLLKNIERVTGRSISIEKIPTVADLHASRMDRTLDLLRSRLENTEFTEADERFRVMVEALADDHDLVEIALAAIGLAHEVTIGGESDDEEIPEIRQRADRDRRDRNDRGDRGDRYDRDRGPRDRGDRDRGPREWREPSQGMGRIFISLGKAAGVQPKDLVGAITGETGLRGNQIGRIEIAPRFSLVEIPADSVNDVIGALKNTTIKGRRPTVRKERKPF